MNCRKRPSLRLVQHPGTSVQCCVYSGIDMKTIFLHIGSTKTGTTALQSFFSLNEARLKTAGIGYPRTGRSGVAHHKLAEVILGRKTARRPVYRELREEIEAAPEQTFVLSSEVFF